MFRVILDYPAIRDALTSAGYTYDEGSRVWKKPGRKGISLGELENAAKEIPETVTALFRANLSKALRLEVELEDEQEHAGIVRVEFRAL